jgi:hypothetical protein
MANRKFSWSTLYNEGLNTSLYYSKSLNFHSYNAPTHYLMVPVG